LIRFTAGILEGKWFDGLGIFIVIFAYIVVTLFINYIMVGPVISSKAVNSGYIMGGRINVGCDFTIPFWNFFIYSWGVMVFQCKFTV